MTNSIKPIFPKHHRLNVLLLRNRIFQIDIVAQYTFTKYFRKVNVTVTDCGNQDF